MKNNNIGEITQSIIDILSKSKSTIWSRDGVVRSVDIATKTCQVEVLAGEFDINQTKSTITCKLSANYNGSFYFIPKVGSDVVIAYEGYNIAYVVVYSDVENVAWTTTGGAIFTLDDKVTIQNNDASMKEIFGDLITLLKSFKLITAWGPSATATTDTLTLIDNLETKINLLIK
jgi:hypothetical protein